MLRAYGFVAITARDVGQLHKTDEQQLEYAVSHRKALLTHNRADFEALALSYFAAGKMHYGIIIAVRRPPGDIIKRLLAILDQVSSDEMVNQIRYI